MKFWYGELMLIVILDFPYLYYADKTLDFFSFCLRMVRENQGNE